MSWSMFDQYVRNNVLTTQLVLDKCSRHNKNLIFASSSSVYGDAERYPTREDTPLNPVSPYGATKEAAERLCRLYQKDGTLKAVILRYFTVYGPRQRPDMGIHRFIERALRGLPIPMYGVGNQERDFTYVSDVVSGTTAAAEEKAWGETINIGGGKTTKLIDLVDLILKETHSHSRTRFEPSQRGDSLKTSADISKAKELLGYNPSVSLQEGMRRQVEWQAARGNV